MSEQINVEYNNLNEVLDKNAAEFPDKILIKYHDKTYTYSEFRQNVLKIANYLLSLGNKKGDYIGVQMTNSAELCMIIYACYRIGAICTPIISLWKAREVAEAIEKAQIETIFIKSTMTSSIKKAAKTAPIKNIIVIGDNTYNDVPEVKGSIWGIIDKQEAKDPKIEVNPNDLATCHFTSGTTGKSKGVLHDHMGYLYTALVHKKTFNLESNLSTSQVLPLYHIFGFTTLHSAIYLGGSIRMLDKFDPQILLKNVEEKDMTLFCGTPSIYNMIMSQDNVEDFKISPKNEFFISGAGPLPKRTKDALEERLLKGNGIVCNCYGGTEDTCVGGSTNLKDECINTPGCIGKPMIGATMELIDNEGNIIPPGAKIENGKYKKGMVANTGPYIMLGYLGDPKAEDPIDHEMTDPVLKPVNNREGKWYWSGDTGYRDEEGLFYLTDRSKDIIKTAERLVYPSEVESVLIEHPEVSEVAVFGIPHEVYGETVCAVVVPFKKTKEIDTDKLQEELITLGNEKLAKYKVPRMWDFKNALETNSMGKVLKRNYREKFIKKVEKEKRKSQKA